MAARDPRTLATTYFQAWQAHDFDTLRSLLTDDATFRAPLGRADDAETCVAGLRGMAQIVTDVDIQKMFVEDGDVMTWFELHTTVAPPSPTANWMHTEDGRIKTIRVTFDARPFPAPGGGSSEPGG